MYYFEIKDFIRDKWIMLIGINIVVVLLWFAVGCQSTTDSLITPDVKVTRSQLTSEIDFLLSTSEGRIADLDRQDKVRQMIFNQVVVSAESGEVNPTGIITTVLAVLGIFSTADDVRLRKKIKKGPIP